MTDPAVQRIDVDGPDVDMDQALRVLYKGELYTGEAKEFMGDARVNLNT